MKNIKFKRSSRSKLLKGINILADAVKITLGPRGRNVIIDKEYGDPFITKDGVTVAKEIELKNGLENVGAKIIKEVASRTNDDTGDGTTTATVLAQSMINEGIKYITLGVNPLEINRGIERAVKDSVKELINIRKKISNKSEIFQVSLISSNNDVAIGKQISKAMEAVGSNGVVTIEESETFKSKLEIVKGMKFDRGYLSPYFVNNSEKQKVFLDDVYIFVYKKKINSLKILIPLLEKISKKNKPLLIISENLDNEVLTTLVINNIRGIIKVVAVKSPGFGERKNDIVEDISILTGCNIGNLSNFKNIKLSDLGKAKKIIVSKEETTIVDGFGSKKNIKNRVKLIKYQIQKSESEYEKEKLKERIAKMVSGIAIIKVGASTELEMKEKKYRVEDSLNATKAAIEEGIVPGGGVALYRVSEKLKKKNKDSIGYKIIIKSIRAPMKQILLNAGLEPKIIMSKIKNKKVNYGFNLSNMKYCNMLDSGIVDPLKVVKCALLNSASITKLILTTDCSIYFKKKKKINVPSI